MKKVICIETRTSTNGLYTVIKDQVYHVTRNVTLSYGIPGYKLAELPDTCDGASCDLFRDYEEPPVLVTFTKIVETYPIHAN